MQSLSSAVCACRSYLTQADYSSSFMSDFDPYATATDPFAPLMSMTYRMCRPLAAADEHVLPHACVRLCALPAGTTSTRLPSPWTLQGPASRGYASRLRRAAF
jgi:hypothetical protein